MRLKFGRCRLPRRRRKLLLLMRLLLSKAVWMGVGVVVEKRRGARGGRGDSYGLGRANVRSVMDEGVA